jgi:cephalosporin hydroxylase
MQERFQTLGERLNGEACMDIDQRSYWRSATGPFGKPTWRGAAILKSAYELAIYPMLLAELRPASVIELGAGPGGSGAFFADQARALGLSTRVASFDIFDKREMQHSAVEFHLQDVRKRDGLARILRDLPKPWLVVEDCHAETYETLVSLDALLAAGDYIVVEDAGPFSGPSKRAAMQRFAEAHGNNYRVDTRYTDFFGRNVTSAVDSVFKRVR